MPTKPLERLMFAQGGLCFFCAVPLPKDEASVEHLVPTARNGSNSDDNCVACCKSMNSLLGSMSLKEKIKVFLAQRGNFKCPNGISLAAVELVPTLLASVAEVPPLAPPPVVTDVPVPVSLLPTAVTAVEKPRVVAPAAVPKSSAKIVLAAVVKDLTGRGKSKPLRLKTLSSTIKALPLGLTDQQVKTAIDQLKSQGKIVVNGTKITYKL